MTKIERINANFDPRSLKVNIFVDTTNNEGYLQHKFEMDIETFFKAVSDIEYFKESLIKKELK